MSDAIVRLDHALLLHGHCQDFMTDLSLSADWTKVTATITDPPYEEEMHEAKKGARGLRTDGYESPKAVDFESIEGMREWIVNATVPMTKGWLIAFCTPEGVAPWRDAIEAAGAKYKRACVWVKPDAAPQFNGQGPAMGAEMFVTAWCGKGHSRWNGGGRRGVLTHLTNASDRHGLHPTEKPLALMREIIELFTDPGDTIFDPFMGTGATGVAALRLGRRFVGIEKQAKYFRAAVARIQQQAAQPDMFIADKKPGKPAVFFTKDEMGKKNGRATPA